MLRIAIDGSCRNNGKSYCVSGGGVFYEHSTDITTKYGARMAAEGPGSTNQRGEMLALLEALRLVNGIDDRNVIIITDSEYLFNSMTKRWPNTWRNNNWFTASGNSVKNIDLWSIIWDTFLPIEDYVTFYYIKGHCLSVGDATARNSLDADPSGFELYQTATLTYRNKRICREMLHIDEVCIKNNGYMFDDKVLEDMVIFNTVADAVAQRAVTNAGI